MSKLVPVKRMNKNGVMVTKHVREDSTTKTSASNISAVAIPPVTPPEDKELAKRIRRLDARLPMTFNRSKFNIHASERLSPWFRDVYAFSCTGNELYAMLERLPVDDALVLTAVGLKPDHLDNFLKKQKWDPDVLVDNTALVTELRARGADARDYVELALTEPLEHVPDSAIADAVEVKSLYCDHYPETTFGPRSTYPSLLLSERIKLSDLKDIGVERCAETEYFQTVLIRLQNGESVCTVDEIRGVLERAEQAPEPHLRKHELIRINGNRALLAIDFGVEIADKAVNPPVIMHAGVYAREHGCTHSEALAFCTFMNAVMTEPYASHVDQYGYVDHWFGPWKESSKAGVPLDKIIEGAQDGLSAQQIIAVNNESIPRSVSGGWL